MLEVVLFFESIEPANTKLGRVLALILRDVWPDFLGFLGKNIANDKAVLLFEMLLPIEEDIFKNRPQSLVLTEGGGGVLMWKLIKVGVLVRQAATPKLLTV